jgi:hypothetical protein
MMHQHDVPEFGVGELIDGALSWQVTGSSAVDVLDSTLLPGGIGIGEPGGHRQGLPEKVMLGKRGVGSEGVPGGAARRIALADQPFSRSA